MIQIAFGQKQRIPDEPGREGLAGRADRSMFMGSGFACGDPE
jgi:hypothetical protein